MIDTGGFRTYRWRETANSYARAYSVDGERAVAVQVALRNSVVRALGERGYRQVFDEAPDFLVSYHFALFDALKPGASDADRRAREAAILRRAGDQAGEVGTAAPSETVRWAELLLRIDDAASGQPAWTGTATGPAPLFRPGRPGIDDAAQRLVARFAGP